LAETAVIMALFFCAPRRIIYMIEAVLALTSRNDIPEKGAVIACAVFFYLL